MKIEYDGEWARYTDDESRWVGNAVYFEKIEGKYYLGLDDYCCNTYTLEELKLLSEFLVEYVKKEESL